VRILEFCGSGIELIVGLLELRGKLLDHGILDF
jgi:hypothetical protein